AEAVPAAAEPVSAPAASPAPPVEAVAMQPGTMIIEKPLRSGQRVYARGDLVVLDLVSDGAEVIAEGNIYVYASLRGRALAGVKGNLDARIFCTCLEPQLISIAGIYRTGETPWPEAFASKPAQIRLSENTLVLEPLRMK
ncbi:septum site-determining protein MinC, partial [Ralstonia pseudosolanacearum]